MRQAVLVCCVVAAAIGLSEVNGAWNYDDATPEGPSFWHEQYPTCGAQNQSPIDIDTGTATILTPYTGFVFTNYDRISATPYTLVNNGHSAQVAVIVKDISVSGGGLSSVYALEQFHFHWGADSSRGSEHHVDAVAHPLELHFVHYNSALYPDVATAAASGDPSAVAVLAVFFNVNCGTPPIGIDEIVRRLIDIPYEDDQVTIPAFNLFEMLPDTQLHNFYRYSGSLTTPACSEVVTWTVFKQPLCIAETQLSQFRQLHANVIGEPNDRLLTHNWRPVQPINARTVFKGPGAPR